MRGSEARVIVEGSRCSPTRSCSPSRSRSLPPVVVVEAPSAAAAVVVDPGQVVAVFPGSRAETEVLT